MKLTNVLVGLDLETTGTWIEKDKIIEIGLVRCHPNGSRDTYLRRVNPGMPIPPEVSEITGIRNEDLKGCPYFKDIAKEVVDFIGTSDIAGFNVERFDLPLLARELADIGIPFIWSNRSVYDAQKIFHLNEKRDLTAAYQFYCRKDLKDAHSALADTEATLAILEAQVREYGKGTDAIETLKEFEYRQATEFFDAERKFRWWNGDLYMMFGKYARKEGLRMIVKKDPQYLEWILTKDFSDEIKVMIQKALAGEFPEPPKVS